MNKKLFRTDIHVKKSKLHGYGVFAGKNIRKGNLIEECYILMGTKKDREFEDFYFDANGRNALLTGYGSIYNHSEEPNADYVLDLRRKVATIIAEVDIYKGHEIYISYGEEWFTSRKMKPKMLRKVKTRRSRK